MIPSQYGKLNGVCSGLSSCQVQKRCFYVFVDRVELEFLMKSFALLTMKSKPTVLMKFSATQKNEIKSTHRRSDFIR